MLTIMIVTNIIYSKKIRNKHNKLLDKNLNENDKYSLRYLPLVKIFYPNNFI